MPYEYKPPATEQAATTTQTPQQSIETPEQKYERLYGQTNQEIKQIREALTSANPSEELKALRAELASLKETVKPPAPQTPGRPKWVEKLATGEYDSADAEIRASIQAQLADDIKRQINEVRSAAYQDALNATHVNLEIDRHVQKLRLENPELAPFEKYLQAPVAQRVEEAKASGKIKTPVDFIREYITAIDSEVENLRNLGLVLRGKGKDEATVRNQQVLASTVVSPNAVTSINTPQGSQQQVSEQSVEDYFAQRRSEEARRKLMVG